MLHVNWPVRRQYFIKGCISPEETTGSFRNKGKLYFFFPFSLQVYTIMVCLADIETAWTQVFILLRKQRMMQIAILFALTETDTEADKTAANGTGFSVRRRHLHTMISRSFLTVHYWYLCRTRSRCRAMWMNHYSEFYNYLNICYFRQKANSLWGEDRHRLHTNEQKGPDIALCLNCFLVLITKKTRNVWVNKATHW